MNVPPGSGLEDLTVAERADLGVWAISQRGDAERGGVVDLSDWPGWPDVMARRFKERFGVDLSAK